MADIFRSALSYISQTGKGDNDFVGHYVELGPVQLKIKKVLAEGKLYTMSLELLLNSDFIK
jgi:hypothetical protein